METEHQTETLVDAMTYGGRDPHAGDLDRDQEFPIRGIH